MLCMFQGERGLPGQKGDRGKPGIKVLGFSYKSSLCFEAFVEGNICCSSNINIFVSTKSNYQSKLANFVSALIVVQALLSNYPCAYFSVVC